MRNVDKHSAHRVCEIILMVCVGVVTIVWGIIPEFVMLTNKGADKIKENLMNTSGRVCDDNGHIVDVDISDESQIDVLSVDNVIKTDEYYIVYDASVDVKVSQGYLRGVPVIVEKNMFGSDTIVKWDYNPDDKAYYYETVIKERQENADAGDDLVNKNEAFVDQHHVKFEYTNAPAYTVGDVLNYIGVKDPYEVATVCVASITDNYDALEYYALWRDKITNVRQKEWVRAVYNNELKQWELCDGEKKIISLNCGLAEYASENDDTYNNDYADDYVIVESDSSLSWAEIE